MPASPGSDERQHSGGASAERLADWQSRRFSALRRHRQSSTELDDALPDDPLAEREASRRAIDETRPG